MTNPHSFHTTVTEAATKASDTATERLAPLYEHDGERIDAKVLRAVVATVIDAKVLQLIEGMGAVASNDPARVTDITLRLDWMQEIADCLDQLSAGDETVH